VNHRLVKKNERALTLLTVLLTVAHSYATVDLTKKEFRMAERKEPRVVVFPQRRVLARVVA
jgi:hypothetical protein